jgi:acyl-CoA dehydrogenase
MRVMPPALVAIVLLALAAGLLVAGRGFWAWVLAAVAGLTWWWMVGPDSLAAFRAVSGTVAVLVLLFGLRPVRAAIFGGPLLAVMRRVLPRMGETERIALEAGTVWWDAELFSGRPRWKTLLDFEPAALSDRERAFLAGPVEELCAMVDDWAVTQQGRPAAAGVGVHQVEGLHGDDHPAGVRRPGFSAAAHSAVIAKLSTRSVTASVTVMVPNSLGPAELLHRYGTEEQKRRWLPALATGREIPCFALTGPENGSDAAAMGATGVVCRGPWEGQDVLGLRLNWTKRYTTLGPVATLIGVAFRLHDPDGLLGAASGDLGITLALVPARLPGVEIGRRHDPLGAPFLNGPNEGRDVFVPLDAIIGGRARAGDGWRMLMDCLAAGRSISLPSLSAGGLQLTTRAVSAYALVRQQFNLSIGRFEGVEERLARIAGLTYLADAARS